MPSPLIRLSHKNICLSFVRASVLIIQYNDIITGVVHSSQKKKTVASRQIKRALNSVRIVISATK